MYFSLHADCVPVRGAAFSAIYDLRRRKIVTFPTELAALLDALAARRYDDAYAAAASDAERTQLREFVDWLVAAELGAFVADPSRFPPIDLAYETPSAVHNTIVDVRDVKHDFARLFAEIDGLGCQYVQVRAYRDLLSLDEIDDIAALAQHTSIRGIEFLLPHSDRYDGAALLALLERRRIITRLIVHSAPRDAELANESPVPGVDALRRRVRFIAERIDGAHHCGQISARTIRAPSVPVFAEAQRRNGCLNGKLSIDENGRIRPCPSYRISFGRLGETPLAQAYAQPAMRAPGAIAKDSVDICRDCELRYACTDCRAYTRSGGMHDKPLKCGYDPYTGRWSDTSHLATLTGAMTVEPLASSPPVA